MEHSPGMDSSKEPAAKSSYGMACISCRKKKIRCNRVSPTCDGCHARSIPCEYPHRGKKRQTASSTEDPNRNLTGLLHRLLQVEQKCSQLVGIPSSPRGSVVEDATPSTPSCRSYQSHSETASPTQAVITGSDTSVAGLDNDSCSISTPPSALCLGQSPASSVDVDERLRQAVGEVVHLKTQDMRVRCNSMAYTIPPTIAKACIEGFFGLFKIDTFPSYIDVELIRLIPDVINRAAITIDPGVAILYYSILYHGSITQEYEADVTAWIYAHCKAALPSWIDLALDTKTDLIAAILLVRASLQQCDFDLGWEVYKVVYQCVTKLNLHNIDQDFSRSFMEISSTSKGANHDRKGLWSLVLTDLFFRLLYDKPPTMTANTVEWRVNLPTIDAVASDSEQVVPNLLFFVKSRLTFSLLSFFDLFRDGLKDKHTVIHRIQELCLDIEALLTEWAVNESLQSGRDSVTDWWMLFDLALTARCSMMIMSFKMDSLQRETAITKSAGDIPDKCLSVEASRSILKLALLGLQRFSNSNTASFLFCTFRCYLPYGRLVKSLLKNNLQISDFDKSNDLSLLENIAKEVHAIAQRSEDLMPLAIVFNDLNEDIRLSNYGSDSKSR